MGDERKSPSSGDKGDDEKESSDKSDEDNDKSDKNDDDENQDEDKSDNSPSLKKSGKNGKLNQMGKGFNKFNKNPDRYVTDKMKDTAKSVAGKAAFETFKAQAIMSAMQAAVKGFIKAATAMVQQAIIFVVTISVAILTGVSVATVGVFVTALIIIGLVVGVIGAFVFGMFNVQPPQKKQPCIVEARALEEYIENSQAALDAKRKANEDKLYAYLESQGFSKMHIAGVAGNMKTESYNMDPTQLEGIYDEKYTMGAKKSAIMASPESIDSHTDFLINNMKKNKKVSVSEDGYKIDGGHKHFGIGIMQWTANRAVTMKKIADAAKLPWYSIDFQILYMTIEKGYGEKLKEYKSLSFQTPEAASEWFGKNYVGNWTNHVDKRKAFANDFYNNSDFGTSNISIDGITKIATLLDENTVDAANAKTITNMRDNCGMANPLDTSSLVSTALSLAVPNSEISKIVGNPIYNGLIVKYDSANGGTYQRSCDRAVSAAMRASNTDTNYPLGNCSSQINYLETKALSGEYMVVAEGSNISVDKLLPGDIFISPGHTFMYVGKDNVRSYDFSTIQKNLREMGYSNVDVQPNGDTYEGSYMQRYAGISVSSSYYISRHGVHNDGGIYKVYRKIK